MIPLLFVADPLEQRDALLDVWRAHAVTRLLAVRLGHRRHEALNGRMNHPYAFLCPHHLAPGCDHEGDKIPKRKAVPPRRELVADVGKASPHLTPNTMRS